MATITSNGTGGGLWSAGATWVGGSVPVNNDAVVIATGDTVTFDVDQSGFADGIAGLTITGALVASATAGSYFLKTKGSITGTGALTAGSSEIPYPLTCTFTILLNGNYGISLSGTQTLNLWCSEPITRFIKLSAEEAAGQTELSVDTDVTGEGDHWKAGALVRVNNSCKSSLNADSEERTIASISSGAITVTSGLTKSKVAGAYLVLISRNIKIIGSANNTGIGINGGKGHNIIAEIRKLNYGINGGYNHGWYFNIGGTISDCGNTGIRVYHSKISAVVCGCDTGIGNEVASNGNILTSNSVVAGCRFGISLLYNCYLFGKIYGCGWGISQCKSILLNGVVDNCFFGMRWATFSSIGKNTTFSNCYTGINAFEGQANVSTYSDSITFSNNNTDMIMDGNDTSFIQINNYNNNLGSLKCFTNGGSVTSQVGVLPSGYTLAYQHALSSASYYCFFSKRITVPAGQSFTIEVQLRKTASMNTLPCVKLVADRENPIIDASVIPVNTFTMTDSTDTWESDTFTIDNSAGTVDMEYSLWFVGKNATGNVYSAYKITTQGGGTSSVKILPFTGKVGL